MTFGGQVFFWDEKKYAKKGVYERSRGRGVKGRKWVIRALEVEGM